MLEVVVSLMFQQLETLQARASLRRFTSDGETIKTNNKGYKAWCCAPSNSSYQIKGLIEWITQSFYLVLYGKLQPV